MYSIGLCPYVGISIMFLFFFFLKKKPDQSTTDNFRGQNELPWRFDPRRDSGHNGAASNGDGTFIWQVN